MNEYPLFLAQEMFASIFIIQNVGGCFITLKHILVLEKIFACLLYLDILVYKLCIYLFFSIFIGFGYLYSAKVVWLCIHAKRVKMVGWFDAGR